MWKFPKTKFVEENSIDKQLEHIMSEVLEIAYARDYGKIVEEIVDLEHSVETLVRIASERYIKIYGIDRLSEKRRKVIAKNKARGYYVSEGSQEES